VPPVDVLAERVAGVAFQSIAVVLAVLGLYNLFRLVVLDIGGLIPEKEGRSYAGIGALTLGFAMALFLAGRLLIGG
jgi:hypothetical protein